MLYSTIQDEKFNGPKNKKLVFSVKLDSDKCVLDILTV